MYVYRRKTNAYAMEDTREKFIRERGCRIILKSANEFRANFGLKIVGIHDRRVNHKIPVKKTKKKTPIIQEPNVGRGLHVNGYLLLYNNNILDWNTVFFENFYFWSFGARLNARGGPGPAAHRRGRRDGRDGPPAAGRRERQLLLLLLVVRRRRALLLLLLVLLVLQSLDEQMGHGGSLREQRVPEQLGRVLEIVRQVRVAVQRVVRPGRGHGGHLELFDFGLLEPLGFSPPVLEPYFHLRATTKPKR